MTEVIFPTAGGCMRPWIWPNGQLHVERCSMDQLRIGDIAVWFDGKGMISHRVVELGADALATRGDSSPAVDAPVKPSQLLGRAVRFTKGPISYRLDGPLVTFLSRVGRKPWAKLLTVARWGRDRWHGR
ncbi:MAG: hypothetical protein WDO69_22015 [Pseudomonadota bacterium]